MLPGGLGSWVAALAAVLASLLAVFLKWRASYWARRGVPHPEPTLLVGNLGPVIRGRCGISSAILDIVRPFRERGLGHCGMLMWCQPVLLVWDPDLAREVLCKQFAAFPDRGVPIDGRDQLSQHLVLLSGGKWRNLRTKMTPLFTSGKLKAMLPLMRDVADDLAAAMARSAGAGRVEVAVDALLSRFAADVIGSVAFGVECHCLRDESNEFLAMSRRALTYSPAQFVRYVLESLHPRLVRLIPSRLLYGDAQRYFLTLMRDTVEHRERHGVQRADFVQLMMELRAHPHCQDEDVALTPGAMAAQAFLFFIGGLDNIANTVAFCLSKLAADPALQERVVAEVRDVLHLHGGLMTYAALQDMALVRGTVAEGLRAWSPVGLLVRKCAQTTRLGRLLVEKGVTVMVVTSAMNADDGAFPDPSRFDPLRHEVAVTAEEACKRRQRHPYASLPFGAGPRNCIAERLSMLEMTVALATLLRDFAFSAGPGYEVDPELDPAAYFPRPKNGFKLLVAARPASRRTE